ncbi:MAG: LlaMI family restriction endonuclease [Defluviitaleaceae bacterium]|nr:LlaMI family restriction endonuclease [Defluviitaleaceae bacterium]
MNEAKQKIIELFNENVKGKSVSYEGINQNHDGKRGHWLEKQFNIKANANNEADLYGYELKNETSSKTSFGDWAANVYIYKNSKYSDLFGGKNIKEKQDSFLRMFGKYNEEKSRYSWSGSPFPKMNKYNDFGQTMLLDDNEDVIIYYSFSKDKREDRFQKVPHQLHMDNVTLAKWFGRSFPKGFPVTKRSTTLSQKLEQKFNDQGWFTCKTNTQGVYTTICFGKPMNYSAWIDLVEKGVVFLDSGMYEGNSRPYSIWRANNAFWEDLIEECY